MLAAVPDARVLAMCADGSEEDTVKDVVRRTVEELGGIDILVNNAQQFVLYTPLEDLVYGNFKTTFYSGFFPAFYYMKHSFPYLKDAAGTIINLASNAGINGEVGMGAYGSNKEAIRGLTRTAANEWGQYGITANCIIPTVMTEDAEVWAKTDPDTYQRALQIIPLHRFGDPELNCGGLGDFLAAPAGKYMTGMSFLVDGGFWMRP